MQVLGRNCRFLQGPGTDPRAVQEIREAMKEGSECTVRILNYKKSGAMFWNMFSLAPMADVDGTLRFFIGVQVDVTAAPGKEEASKQGTIPSVNPVAVQQAKEAQVCGACCTHASAPRSWGARPAHTRLRFRATDT